MSENGKRKYRSHEFESRHVGGKIFGELKLVESGSETEDEE
jgi:hypothetical protein